MKSHIRTWLVEQFGDDETIINEIYAEYVRSSRAKAQELNLAVETGDTRQIDRIAHAMKGTALMIGDQEIAEAAIALRKAGLEGMFDACRACASTLVALIENLDEPAA